MRIRDLSFAMQGISIGTLWELCGLQDQLASTAFQYDIRHVSAARMFVSHVSSKHDIQR